MGARGGTCAWQRRCPRGERPSASDAPHGPAARKHGPMSPSSKDRLLVPPAGAASLPGSGAACGSERRARTWHMLYLATLILMSLRSAASTCLVILPFLSFCTTPPALLRKSSGHSFITCSTPHTTHPNPLSTRRGLAGGPSAEAAEYTSTYMCVGGGGVRGHLLAVRQGVMRLLIPYLDHVSVKLRALELLHLPTSNTAHY